MKDGDEEIPAWLKPPEDEGARRIEIDECPEIPKECPAKGEGIKRLKKTRYGQKRRKKDSRPSEALNGLDEKRSERAARAASRLRRPYRLMFVFHAQRFRIDYIKKPSYDLSTYCHLRGKNI